MTASTFIKLCLLLTWPLLATGNVGLFTYFETPLFDRIGNKGVVMAQERAVGAGPSQWPNILFPPQLVPTGNQCGGIGQVTGYGQSPIVIPADVRDRCDVGFKGYVFEPGTCMCNVSLITISTANPHHGQNPCHRINQEVKFLPRKTWCFSLL